MSNMLLGDRGRGGLTGSDGEGLGDTVERVLDGRLPVLSLLHSLGVGGSELGVVAGGRERQNGVV
jgi:hypothetical protein